VGAGAGLTNRWLTAPLRLLSLTKSPASHGSEHSPPTLARPIRTGAAVLLLCIALAANGLPSRNSGAARRWSSPLWAGRAVTLGCVDFE
jgi:hypothetical protein